MKNDHAHDIFLLMLVLSQLKDSKRIVEVFLEAINGFNLGVGLRVVAFPEDTKGVVEKISSSGQVFGYMAIEGDLERVGPRGVAVLRNAVRMLAILLENRRYADLLEARYEDTKRDLHEVEELNQRILSVSPDMVYLYDVREQRLVYTNPAAVKILGYSLAQMLSPEPGYFASFIHPEDISRVSAHNNLLLASGTNEVFETEFRMKCADESWIWVQSREIVFSTDSGGKPKLKLGLARDTTEQYRIQKERELLLERLSIAKTEADHANRAKSLFLANMSHEIRTPLNAIVGFANLLAEAVPDLSRERRYTDIINSSCEQLLNIVDDVLDLSSIEANKLKLIDEPFSLREAMLECLDALRAKVDLNLVEIRYDPDPALPDFVIGDPWRLRQILLNLLMNAAKFTRHGYILFRSRRLSRKGRLVTIEFTIQDTGKGIGKEYFKKLFTPFSQENESGVREYGGTGLGLSITKRVVDAMGGSIAVSSEPEAGSSFVVVLSLLTSEVAFGF